MSEAFASPSLLLSSLSFHHLTATHPFQCPQVVSMSSMLSKVRFSQAISGPEEGLFSSSPDLNLSPRPHPPQ
jgi:hypothetical protein